MEYILSIMYFFKSHTSPKDEKRIKFKAAREKSRKYIKRAFGVLFLNVGK